MNNNLEEGDYTEAIEIGIKFMQLGFNDQLATVLTSVQYMLGRIKKEMGEEEGVKFKEFLKGEIDAMKGNWRKDGK
jgi:hypothetical protein